MKAVGVKILKARLSEYLRLVKLGESILVTERDEVIAELKPSRRQSLSKSTLEEELEIAAQLGQVTLRSQYSKGFPKLAKLSAVFPHSSEAVLNELRADRKS